MKINSYKTELAQDGRINLVAEKTFTVDGRKQYNNPAMVADFVGDEIGLRKAGEEFVYIICLDSANHVIGLFEASHGGANASMFPRREICKKILLLNAVGIFITHNHPSGNTEPSIQDIASTKALKEACDIIDITLLDHVIVGGNTNLYYSFKENQII